MTQLSSGSAEAAFKNRRAGLIIFGIGQILLGLGCLLLMGFTLLSPVISTTAPGDMAQADGLRLVLPGLLVYAGLAIWFIWMGIGSIAGRRWARALTLIFSWLWLVGGVGGMAAQLWLTPILLDQLARQTGFSATALAVMEAVMLGVSAVLYVLVPAALVWFYQSKHVRATVNRLDPQPRWTDRCPLPVLALSALCLVGAVGLLLTGFTGWVMPYFGQLVHGPAGMVLALGGSLGLAYSAWACYRLRLHGWWSALLLSAAGGASVALTLGQAGLGRFYELVPWPDDQRELMQALTSEMEPWPVIGAGVMLAALLGYVLAVRRFFRSA